MVAEMKKDVNLLVRVEDLTTFSDNVLFESKDDVVFLNFTQTIPTPGGDNGKEISQAKLVSRVVLTIPHFLPGFPPTHNEPGGGTPSAT